MIVAVRRLVLAALVLLAPALAAAQTYTIAPNPFLTDFNNSGAKISAGCIWSYTAGTTTPATTYTTSSGTANTNPIITDSAGRFTMFLAPGSSYKFVYENIPCSSSSHGAVLRTADNISAVPSSAASVDVTGIAGESITAGQCVYLSDGSGSKTPGQWYKCDSGNTYSSSTNWVGIATVNITSTGSGTIRVAGSVTGLTVVVGTKYYVGAGGALTSTAPLNARLLGEADSATSLVLTGNPTPLMTTAGTIGQVIASAGAGVVPVWQTQGFFDDFRLSLTTATCVTTADVTAAGTLYLTPCAGNRITLFDTSGNPETCSTAEVSIAVPATTSQMYDVWAYDSTFGTCTVTLELLAWTNDTTRATALVRTNGRWTKTGAISRLYVGSMRTTAVANQTEDSVSNRFVWNYFNRVDAPIQRFETTGTWTYGINTIRQANGAAANQVNFIVGVSEDVVVCDLKVTGAALAGTSIGGAGIGLDSTTTFAGNQAAQQVYWAINTGGNVSTTYRGYPGIGKHSLMWNEDTWAGGSTITWYGTSTAVGGGATAASAISGLLGSVKR